MENETITLRPNDYIVFAGGLMVKNMSEDNMIEFPVYKYKTWKINKLNKEDEMLKYK